MKKIILALMIVLMISNVWAGECPNEPPLCLDLNINATDSLNIKGGNLIIGDGCSAITPDGEDFCVKGDVGIDGILTMTIVDPATPPFSQTATWTGSPIRVSHLAGNFFSSSNQSGSGQAIKSFANIGGDATNAGGGDYTGKMYGILSEVNLSYKKPGLVQSATIAGMYANSSVSLITLFGDKTITITDLNGYWSRGFINVSNTLGSDTVTVDNLSHFRVTDSVDDSDGPLTLNLTKQVGLLIENLTAGASSGGADYGIVLDSGDNCIWMDGVSGIALCSETVEISAATLNGAAAVTVIAARGADTLLEFVRAVLPFDDATNFDTCDATSEFVFQYETSGNDVSDEFESVGFLDGGTDAIRMVSALSMKDVDITANANKAIQIFNTGTQCANGTGVIHSKITYRVHVLGL